ncbi:MAG: glycosyltransferase [Gemmatimonadota bacterium]|nr:glycosyltransferase [Gemmatimonadota bacterium]
MSDPRSRPRTRGKFLYAGDRRLEVLGYTYGPFAPAEHRGDYPSNDVVDRDFAAIRSTGANALRVYTVPPRWLLDLADRHGLRVLIGIPWEQHVAFLDEAGLADSIEERVRLAVRRCKRHPAVLGYAVGNEIPASIVRWTGQRRIERHIERLWRAVKQEDPEALATYVNYPSTEYLELPFLDFVGFNVYLESVDRFAAYLKRLHNLAGERPLVMGEIGLDSSSHGEDEQAWQLAAQVRTARRTGCAGSFVFAWTDEWRAGGTDITRWRFGVTDRERRPKPALDAVRRSFSSRPLAPGPDAPRVSVVVCAYNAEATLADCLEGATALDYPDYEVIVVDDGSTDRTAEIAGGFDVRLISTSSRGLSHARNTGLEAATGRIVAYTDADARPEPDWLTHLALAFDETGHAGIGGPNLAPGGDGWIADCVENAPGGPVHVLLSDDEAEHIPGCNMAFRREALEAIDGFDPRFRVAGDDVDVCWRIQAAGMTLGFSPVAVVWHHPRDSIRAYWRQQAGYGRAEALLEEKWPEKYNTAGHVTWGGRVYQAGLRRLLPRQRVYHGVWGTAPYQSAEPQPPGVLEGLASTPEWYLVLGCLAFLSTLGATWAPLRLTLPVLAVALTPVLARAIAGSRSARFPDELADPTLDRRRRAVTALLHLLQPAARLRGRVRYGLTPWRVRSARRFSWPTVRNAFLWSESWRSPSEWVGQLEGALRLMRARVLTGGEFDRWDLTVKSGMFGRARVYTCTEEHGNGRQFIRFRFVPWMARPAVVAIASAVSLGAWAFADGAGFAGGVFIALATIVTVRVTLECGAVLSACLQATDEMEVTDLRTRKRVLEPVAPHATRSPGRAPAGELVSSGTGSAP